MDERLQKSLEFSNYRTTLNNQIQQLKVTAQTQLIHSHNGGTFVIDSGLISFIHLLVQRGLKDYILLDDNKLPIKIENLELFLQEIMERYSSVMNNYHLQYEKIKKARKIQSIVDLQ